MAIAARQVYQTETTFHPSPLPLHDKGYLPVDPAKVKVMAWSKHKLGSLGELESEASATPH
jgi:hypothetical protein